MIQDRILRRTVGLLRDRMVLHDAAYVREWESSKRYGKNVHAATVAILTAYAHLHAAELLKEVADAIEREART